jgi:hypothetical protein
MLNKPMIGVALAVIAAAAGGWYYVHSRNAPLPPVPVAARLDAAPPAGEPAIEHPVPAAADDALSKSSLPTLNDSDTAVSGALGEAVGGLTQYLVPESIVRHLVVTIDNLTRQKVAVEKRPTVAPAGTFVVDGDELHATLDSQNFARYQPMINVLRDLDMQRLAAVYLHFYPLFQQSYQDLGYPNGYFNDRLVQVIDVLLAAPQPADPVALVRPNVMYVFADPALEARPAGQKLLIRMGPDNAAVVKAKLRELRALVTATPPKR